jgi:drug/metabolite transporter (DMT)-like permease
VNPALGISLKLASAFTFTLMSAGVKIVSARIPVGELVFCRSFFALIPLIIWLRWNGEFPQALRTRNLHGHMRRGIVGVTGMFCGFSALSLLPLPDATALGYAAPLLTVVLAALMLKETVRIYRWSAVAVGFIGVLIMLWPQLSGLAGLGRGDGVALGAMFALGGAVCSAFSTIEVRRLTETERTGTIVFYMCVIFSAFGLLSLPFGWRTPTAQDAALLVLVGVLGGVAQILLTQSYYYADASLVAPFDYTTMIFAGAVGWFVFGEFPQTSVIFGATIVVAAGIFVIWREHQLGLARRKSREAAPSRAI